MATKSKPIKSGVLSVRPTDANDQLIAVWEKAVIGDANAMNSVGNAYKTGVGVPSRDDKRATKWFTAAADRGQADAMASLAKVEEYWGDENKLWPILSSFGVIAVPLFLGIISAPIVPTVITVIAALSALPFTVYHSNEFVTWLLNGRHARAAQQWTIKAAENGHVDSMYKLSELYRGPLKNNVLSISWLKRASDSGHVKSTYELSQKYARGDLVDYDLAKCFELLERAAAKGHAVSALTLSEIYSETLPETYSSISTYRFVGEDKSKWRKLVPVNAAKARAWLSQASNFIEEGAHPDWYSAWGEPSIKGTIAGLKVLMEYNDRHTRLYAPRGAAVVHPELDTNGTIDRVDDENQAEATFDAEKLARSLAELDSLIGLDSVKKEIKQLVNVAILNKKRIEQSLEPISLSLHLVFEGNPGTGKTTVARLVGDIYVALGFLTEGHVVETDKSGLVANYLGQTPGKTKAVIDEALDGVLFIDEAYSLTSGNTHGANEYGAEAVEVILKEMEDNRDRLAVVVAGYPEKMQEFIASNPGLKSRFTTVIHFEDYSVPDLSKIFSKFAADSNMRLAKGADAKVSEVCTSMIEASNGDFGNGRDVRNLFERTIKQVAARVANGDTNIVEIKATDIPAHPGNKRARPFGWTRKP